MVTYNNRTIVRTCHIDCNTGGNGIDEIIYPSCDEDILAEDWELTDWSEGVTDDLICPLCHKPAEINKYKFEPAWGFSKPGFKFWNWPELRLLRSQ